MKYIVWFSWWIDSSYVAYKLIKDWYDVLLVHIKQTYERNKCCLLPEELYKVSNNLWCELLIIDLIKEFKELVINDFVEKYKSWITPNPCIKCNEIIRFIALEKIRQEKWFDYVTTWHYAWLYNYMWENYLKTPYDTKKDQTYMLYRLSNIKLNWYRIINKIKFILDYKLKSEVINELKENWINEFISKESQNICFVPDDNYIWYIKKNYELPYNPWRILSSNWDYLWEHKWIENYTIWQRHWLNLQSNEKLYINKIDKDNNIIYVWKEEELFKEYFELKNIFFHEELLKQPWETYCKVRYHHKLQEIKSIEIEKNEKIIIRTHAPIRAITNWQHWVIYKIICWEFVIVWWWEIFK